jgi:hypothetical protein
MLLFILKGHLVWTSPDGTAQYYYYDETTWVVGTLALAWLTWFLVSRYLRGRALRRPTRRRADHNSFKRVARIKSELSSQYLVPGFSTTIHAVGIGRLEGSDNYCIQVFLSDPNQEIWAGAGAATLPANFRGVPVIPIELPQAGFLVNTEVSSLATASQYPNGIRERQEMIVGGISGANMNLSGQSGTIGYFCTRRTRLRRRKEIHLLSNSHVFADLRKIAVDAGDLIMQPSPGEPGSNRPIATLVNFSVLQFDDLKNPNHVDAAIAKLWDTQHHQSLIPLIGAVKGYVEKKDVEIGEAARKFGRTTGYTEGRIFSISLDIWIRYDRTGQSAFFQDQFLIEPASPQFTKFVAKGDSGSLLVDAEQRALGLIFAGVSEAPQSTQTSAEINPPDKLKKIEGYGVANPISEVLDRMRVELLV